MTSPRSFRLAPAPAHMPHLDSLRALAVAAVVAHHYRIEYGGVDDLGVIAFGGVRMFFSLSGFLITGILLRSRALCESRHASQGPAIGRFYVRRALRIFPLYYLVVTVALLVDLPPARTIAPWLWTYTLNIHMARQGWYEANFAHFWSLAVEEQFYLAWPWIVAYVGRRWLLPVVVVLGLSAPLSRLGYVWSGYAGTTPLGTYIGTISCLDALGAGALLAVLRHDGTAHDERLRPARRLVVPGAVAMLLVVHSLPDPRVSLVLGDALLAVLFTAVIAHAAQGISGWPGAVLGIAAVQHLGKISYGIYVYHPFMPRLLHWVGAILGLSAQPSGLVGAAIAVGLTLVVASISWSALERPVNQLKRFFGD